MADVWIWSIGGIIQENKVLGDVPVRVLPFPPEIAHSVT